MTHQQRTTCCRLPSERNLAASPLTPPASMFCFCFQSPSLKLQALEGDPGPSDPQIDPKAWDRPLAREQPVPAEDKRPGTTHKLLLHLPPSAPAQDRQIVDSSLSGRTEKMQNYHLQLKYFMPCTSILSRASTLKLK